MSLSAWVVVRVRWGYAPAPGTQQELHKCSLIFTFNVWSDRTPDRKQRVTWWLLHGVNLFSGLSSVRKMGFRKITRLIYLLIMKTLLSHCKIILIFCKNMTFIRFSTCLNWLQISPILYLPNSFAFVLCECENYREKRISISMRKHGMNQKFSLKISRFQ